MSFLGRKRIIRIGLLCSCMLLSGCAAEKEEVSTTLYREGLEIIEKMDKIAECREYIDLVTSAPQLTDIVEDIGEKDYTKPNVVYGITITEDAMQVALSLINDSGVELPKEIMPDIYRRFLSAVSTSLNAAEGTEALAITSILMLDSDFLCEDLTENTLYLYLYQDAYPVIVVFAPMDQGIVRAQGQFIINKQFSWELTEEDIVRMLEGTGYLSGCEIRKIEVP